VSLYGIEQLRTANPELPPLLLLLLLLAVLLRQLLLDPPSKPFIVAAADDRRLTGDSRLPAPPDQSLHV